MSGGDVDEPDRETWAEDSDEDWAADQGSVGDWALPGWFHRVGWPVWAFVGLAIADVLIALYAWAVSETPAPIDVSIMVGFIAPAIPILLPAAVFWHARHFRRPLSDPLLAGSVLVAVGALLHTSTPALELLGQGYIGRGGHTPYYDLIDTASLLCAVVGPLLLARAILTRRRAARPRWGIGLGLVLGVVNVLVLALAVWGASAFLSIYGSDDPSLTTMRFETIVQFARALSLIGWTALAWGVVTGAGDPGHRTLAGRLAFGAMAIWLCLLALSALFDLDTFFVSPSGPAQLFGAAQALWVAYFQVSGLASIASDVLLVAAFVLGFGQADAHAADGPPELPETDADRDLEPVLRPG